MDRLVQVACATCGAGNRIGAGDVSTAKCGRCSATLFPGVPLDVDDDAFDNHLRHTKGKVVLDVWAPWCGPCRMLAPHYAEAARRLKGVAVFLKMNADHCATPARLGVRGIPALFLFEDGKLIAQRSGMMTSDVISRWIEDARRLA